MCRCHVMSSIIRTHRVPNILFYFVLLFARCLQDKIILNISTAQPLPDDVTLDCPPRGAAVVAGVTCKKSTKWAKWTKWTQ